jgi:hypothetical protein
LERTVIGLTRHTPDPGTGSAEAIRMFASVALWPAEMARAQVDQRTFTESFVVVAGNVAN